MWKETKACSVINGCLFMQKQPQKTNCKKAVGADSCKDFTGVTYIHTQCADLAGGRSDSLISILSLSVMGPVVAILLTLSPSLFFSTLRQFFIAMLQNSTLNVSNQKDSQQSCFSTAVGSTVMTSYTIIICFTLLPLYIFIIYLGFQQWLQQHSAKSISHSDVFTFNMIVMELINIIGSIIIVVGKQTSLPQLMEVGSFLFSFNFSGQVFFHLLTCVERYLAVVHPFIYRSLWKEKAIRIRNAIIVWVWLLCLASLGIIAQKEKMALETVFYVCILPMLLVMSLCNLSILLVLNRARPGDSRHPQADQSKMRAFYTILLITAVLLLKFGWEMISFRIIYSLQLHGEQKCAIILSTVWTNIPSNLVLPLLFLHRAGKLQCLKNQRG